MKKIVLASSSPYRQELLRRLHLDVETCSPDIDETPLPEEKPTSLVERLSIEKGQAIASRHPDAIIISGDQVAVCKGVILGKPGDKKTAVEQLRFISGAAVVFETGLCVLQSDTGEYKYRLVPTKVQFRELSEEMIENYIEKEPAFNCAGSFKSEGYGISLTTSIQNDDPTALIGLPLIHLTQMLETVGVKVI